MHLQLVPQSLDAQPRLHHPTAVRPWPHRRALSMYDTTLRIRAPRLERGTVCTVVSCGLCWVHVYVFALGEFRQGRCSVWEHRVCSICEICLAFEKKRGLRTPSCVAAIYYNTAPCGRLACVRGRSRGRETHGRVSPLCYLLPVTPFSSADQSHCESLYPHDTCYLLLYPHIITSSRLLSPAQRPSTHTPAQHLPAMGSGVRGRCIPG